MSVVERRGPVVDQFVPETSRFDGDRRLELPDGGETLAEAVSRCDAGEVQSPRAAREIVLSSLSEAAIGRKYYSDRDPPVPGVEQREPVSL